MKLYTRNPTLDPDSNSDDVDCLQAHSPIARLLKYHFPTVEQHFNRHTDTALGLWTFRSHAVSFPGTKRPHIRLRVYELTTTSKPILSTMTSIRLFVLGACLCTMLTSSFFLQSCFVLYVFFRVF